MRIKSFKTSKYKNLHNIDIKFDADDLAKCCDSINYEVLCLLKKRVPRVYIKDGKIFDVKNNV